MSKMRVSVSVDDAHLQRFPEVVEASRRAGLEVEEQMDAIGVISGQIESAKVGALRRVSGVGHVEEERRFQIAPPDSEIQ